VKYNLYNGENLWEFLMHSKKVSLISLVIALFIGGFIYVAFKDEVTPKSFAHAQQIDYPGIQHPSCLSYIKEKKRSKSYLSGREQAIRAIALGYKAPKGVWDQKLLAKDQELKQALDEFMTGKRGRSVRSLVLHGKSALEIHNELMDRGFQYQRIPLINPRKNKKAKYWRRDGSTTNDKTDPELLPHDLYIHHDGGIVRMKPEGIPDPRHPSPAPHVSKSVLRDLTLKKLPFNKEKALDTRSRNEAFKITDGGLPIPKAPGKKGTMRMLHSWTKIKNSPDKKRFEQEQKGWVQGIMQYGHLDMKVNYSHCQKGSIGQKRKNKSV